MARGYNTAMDNDVAVGLVRIAHALDTQLQIVSDPRRRRALIEECMQIEWRVNALATPRPYRMRNF